MAPEGALGQTTQPCPGSQHTCRRGARLLSRRIRRCKRNDTDASLGRRRVRNSHANGLLSDALTVGARFSSAPHSQKAGLPSSRGLDRPVATDHGDAHFPADVGPVVCVRTSHRPTGCPNCCHLRCQWFFSSTVSCEQRFPGRSRASRQVRGLHSRLQTDDAWRGSDRGRAIAANWSSFPLAPG